MNTLWVYVDGNWKQSSFIPSAFRHSVADHYNKKYGKRHYWVSTEKPGTDELEKIRSAKKQSELEFVDTHEDEEGIA